MRLLFVAGLPLWIASLAQAADVLTNQNQQIKPANQTVGFQDCKLCPAMIEVPESSFMMGSDPSESERSPDESPQHKVVIRYPFAVSRTKITFAEWDACVAQGGCNRYSPSDETWGRGERPVLNVSWNDAQAYVQWLAQKTGKPYRLLSEAEWEYVARAGTSTAFNTGTCISPSQANLDHRFDYARCPVAANGYIGKTVAANAYPPNMFGVYQMAGNLFEWVQDPWHEGYSGAPTDGRSWEKGGNPSLKVVRGGSWYAIPASARSANRYAEPMDFRSDNVGFRVALSLSKK